MRYCYIGLEASLRADTSSSGSTSLSPLGWKRYEPSLASAGCGHHTASVGLRTIHNQASLAAGEWLLYTRREHAVQTRSNKEGPGPRSQAERDELIADMMLPQPGIGSSSEFYMSGFAALLSTIFKRISLTLYETWNSGDMLYIIMQSMKEWNKGVVKCTKRCHICGNASTYCITHSVK